jgi:hypothetical protein
MTAPAWDALARFGDGDLYDQPELAWPCTGFREGVSVPQYFLLDRGELGLFLVNTEGSRYCRYLIEVTD